jgi:GntR family transcriptional regulator / MocR family aminotransferase
MCTRKDEQMRTRIGPDLCFCQIVRGSGTPIFRQVYAQLRSAILSRTLRPATKLPSTRDLADGLNVARASVVSAYEQLLAEGYAYGKIGSGTFVSADPPQAIERNGSERNRQPVTEKCRVPSHAPIFDALREFSAHGDERPFGLDRVFLDQRTIDAWRKLGYRACRSFAHPRHLGYSDPCGFIELREALGEYLFASRAVKCKPEQIIITTGGQQAIDMAIRVLLAPGEKVWVEDPAHPLTHFALVAARADVHPIPVDEQGIDIEAGIRSAPNARAAFLTPSHQFPTGVELSMARRLAILAWARETGSWIVEDDHGSEFRYSGRPLASLQGLDNGERVIYVGTLNKALFPGLRLGYAVVPHSLIPAFTGLRCLIDRHPSTLSQAILVEFIGQGHFAVHIRRMRNRYRHQRDLLTAELTQRLGPAVTIQAREQGTHLVAHLDESVSDVDLETAARHNGVAVRALSRLYKVARPRSGVILGFTGYPDNTIIAAAKRLAETIRWRSTEPSYRLHGRHGAGAAMCRSL